MHITLIQQLIGLFMMAYSATFVPPIIVSLLYQDGQAHDFVYTLLVALGGGFLIWWPARKQRYVLRVRDGFIIVAAFWCVLSVVSALPFIFSPHLPFGDALFEAVSGVTTTGSTVIVGLDYLPESILYYRQQLQWLGGMGVIVLAVAIAPMLGVGGMRLYRAETPGPMKDSKLTPRIKDTASALWKIYFGLTVLCALAYLLAGMSLFDAITHSFATLSTGGFSTHDASMGFFDSPLLETIACVFMVLGSINFSVHFIAFYGNYYRAYTKNSELKAFLLIIAVVSVCIAGVLLVSKVYFSIFEAARFSVFQVISVITTTGFTTVNFSVWPHFVPVLLILISFVGGCSGSTAGGMKVIRWLLLYKQGVREVDLLIHPNACIAIKLNGRVLPSHILNAVWGFFAVYMITFCVLMLLLMATGVDQVTAFSAIATCINNTGPGLGAVSSNFVEFSAMGKLISSAAMLLGRLEIFTLFVLISPTFWRG